MKDFAQYLIESDVHPFSRLGAPPYTYDGLEVNMISTPGTTVQRPGGTCDYCGTSIAYQYYFKSSDGKKFKVGSECMLKADSVKRTYIWTGGGEESLTDIVKREKKKLDKANAGKKRLSAAEQMKSDLEANADKLKAKPHPKGWAGKSLYDYVKYCVDNGMGGKNVAALIKDA